MTPEAKIVSVMMMFTFCLSVQVSAYSAERPLKLAKQPGAAITEKTIAIVQCTLNGIQRSYEFVDVPWKRAQKGTRSGAYDGFFIASLTKQRDMYAVASAPLITSKWYFLTRKEQILEPTNPAFKYLSFGANAGTARFQWLVMEHDSGRHVGPVHSAPTMEETWKMFGRERFDVLLENAPNIARSKSRLEGATKGFHLFLAREIPLSMYFGKEFLEREPGFLAKFNTQLAKCLR